MNLNEIRKSEIVLIDANILLYGILYKSDQCVGFLRRCAEGEIIGVVGLQQLAEVMHRLIMVEARENEWTSSGNPVKALSERPDRVRALSRYADAVKGLLASGFRFETLMKEDFISALALQRQYGFLTNDALLLSVSERLRIKSIASADKIFAQVSGIILYSPNDIVI